LCVVTAMQYLIAVELTPFPPSFTPLPSVSNSSRWESWLPPSLLDGWIYGWCCSFEVELCEADQKTYHQRVSSQYIFTTRFTQSTTLFTLLIHSLHVHIHRHVVVVFLWWRRLQKNKSCGPHLRAYRSYKVTKVAGKFREKETAKETTNKLWKRISRVEMAQLVWRGEKDLGSVLPQECPYRYVKWEISESWPISRGKI
jgi:hypothetical protein